MDTGEGKSERAPKLREGLDILEEIENKVISLESRLSSLAMSLMGAGIQTSAQVDSIESKVDTSNEVDKFGRIVHKGKSISKFLTAALDRLTEIEKEI